MGDGRGYTRIDYNSYELFENFNKWIGWSNFIRNFYQVIFQLEESYSRLMLFYFWKLDTLYILFFFHL